MPTMHLFHTPQCTIQNSNVRIFVLNGEWTGALLDCKISIFWNGSRDILREFLRYVYPAATWRNDNAIITSNDFATSFWRNSDISIVSRVRWVIPAPETVMSVISCVFCVFRKKGFTTK